MSFGGSVRGSMEALPRRAWYHGLVGRPLATADAAHQTIGKLVGLAVFSSDALSSTAYATQEIMVILASAALAGGFDYIFPIAIAIAALLFIVTLSYQQTIHAYPGGGGAYIVARDNLGEGQALTAGASLLTDYILTVAVSVASGVAQITSGYPELYPYRVALAVAFVLLIALINLRGVKESGAVFAIPTYFFIGMMYVTVATAIWRHHAFPDLRLTHLPEHMAYGALAVTPFLLLHAFASGTSALTGVEAISNGITAFREPRSRNAGITLLWMSAILGTMFLSISYLVHPLGLVPSEQETVISQLARFAFGGRNLLYFGTIWATTVILVMGANTAFADFPRLAALVAGDGFLPRQLTFKGSRLVFSRGIVTLSVIACLLIVAFHASVTRLIPLYAIGVFLSFTLSQAGMAKRWWKAGRLAPGVEIQEPGSTLRHERGWLPKMLINGFGSVCTAVVMVVFAVTKFHDGAWVVLLLLPLMVWAFFRIHHHYRELARELSLEAYGAPPRLPRHRIILPISSVHRGTVAALRYARSQTDDVTAVYISLDPEHAEQVQRKWERWGDGTRLVVLESPYRLLLEPLLSYIEDVAAQRQPNEVVTVLVPQFVPGKWWHNLLHAQTAMWLRLALRQREGIVVIDAPYQLRRGGRGQSNELL